MSNLLRGQNARRLIAAICAVEALVLAALIVLLSGLDDSPEHFLLAGVFIVAAAWPWWLLARARQGGTTGDEAFDEAYMMLLKTWPAWIGATIWFGVQATYGLYKYDAGHRLWWWAVIAATIYICGLVCFLIALYRRRQDLAKELAEHERKVAEGREGRWAPWG